MTPRAAYVHVPFCKTKCPYCDFFSVTDETLIAAYLTALDTEARYYRDQFPVFDSLFIGGGTPSWLGERQIAGLMKILRRHFVFVQDSHSWAFGPPINYEKFVAAGVSPAVIIRTGETPVPPG